jgi:succinate dehydrogenase hydrophobic anchor subunit
LHTRMPDARTEHSRMGIASFVIASLSGLFLVGLVSVGLILRYVNPPGDPLAHGFWLLSLTLLSVLCALVALGLGIAGTLQRRRRRLFAFLGIAGSILVFVALVTLNALLP